MVMIFPTVSLFPKILKFETASIEYKKALAGRGLLCDCETFAKVRLQL